MTVLHWFRDDLRLSDNPALNHASQSAKTAYVYILEEDEAGSVLGGAAQVWLHHSLSALNQQLDGNLLLYKGCAIDILPELMGALDAKMLTMTRRYHQAGVKTDSEIREILAAQGKSASVISGNLLWEPEEITKQDGTPYKVFTPFYRRGCLNAQPPRIPLAAPALDHAPIISHNALPLEALRLLDGADWQKNITKDWDMSEKGGHARLQAFAAASSNDGINDYVDGRNFPARTNVSRLSPYLRFGQISAHQAWHEAGKNKSPEDKQLDIFRSELGWREFSYSLLHFNPDMKTNPLQKRFANFGWAEDSEHLKRWQRGQTGYPIVDAAMRELYQTGYMHNRVRMIVGSFLVKNLLLHWHHGEAWFWDCLFDADCANNSAGWQWIAGCGADAAPYFRVFNPVTQGQKFDPDGTYTRRFVPELQDMPNKFLFNPWDAPKDVLKRAGVQLGQNYPQPIVEVKASRQRALDAFADLPKSKI
jgi:deoxyribodipyrimidine photo-lyase